MVQISHSEDIGLGVGVGEGVTALKKSSIYLNGSNTI